MALVVGTRLGPYEILKPIGVGGMGEVYRAKDTKLKRDVALKVLPEAFASDPERMARFQREAEVLASLNHPNIAHLYGVEGSALVMELVEGETLARPLPLDTALNYAKQIAEALEYAHERGVMHRDLKPANIKVTPEGIVKLLDFGLAKAIEDPVLPGEDPANSPTLTLGATRIGVILGTAAYMSPEQAGGKPADRRADIWSFGAVLYEMLAGKKAFEGDSVSDTLASVLKLDPDWNALPASTPPLLLRLIRRSLTKNRKQRLQAIGEARIAIEEVLANPAADVGLLSAPPKRTRVAWLVAAAGLLVAIVASAIAWRATRPQEHPLMRFSVDLGPDAVPGPHTTPLLSPDGTRVVFPIRTNGTLRLASRNLDRPQVVTMSGTEGANDPFFSPDGQWLGFFANGKLKKVAVQGGAPLILCDVASSARGASWGEDGNIVFAPQVGSGLVRVPASGGVPQPLTELARNEVSHRWPQVLPGAKAVLFTTGTNPVIWDDAHINVLSLNTGQIKTVQRGGYFGRYVPSSDSRGYLLYLHEGTLFGARFDPGRLEISGTPAPLLEDVAGNVVEAGGEFDWSRSGLFVYLSGRVAAGSSYPIDWMDSAGKTTALFGKPGQYGAPRFSPDGRRLAFTALGSRGVDIWVYDWDRDTPTQLTFSNPGNLEMAWAPDGRHIVFGSNTGGVAALWWMRSDGSGEPQKLLERKSAGVGMRPQSFTPDGKRLVFDQNVVNTVGVEIWILPMDLTDPEHPKAGKPELFLSGPQREVDAALSPDGQLIAYSSNESGVDDVFVRPFPGPGGKWRVSTGGGKYPTWSRNGRELFYLSGTDRIMVADYTVQAGAFNGTKPRVWSDRQVLRPSFIRVLDLHPDGKRFAVFPRVEVEEAKGNLHLTFLLNFGDEIRRRLEPGGN